MTSWGETTVGKDKATLLMMEDPHFSRVLCPIPLMANNSSVVVGNAFAIAAATFLGKSTSSCCCNVSSMVLYALKVRVLYSIEF